MLTTSEQLFEAVENEDWELITESLRNGSIAVDQLDLQDDEGRTILMLAAQNREPPCVKALLECGADIRVEDAHGEKAIFFATKTYWPLCFHLLIEAGANIHETNFAGENLLMAGSHCPEITAYLLEHGLNVNHRSHSQSTPLHYAVKNRYAVINSQTECIRLLLQHNADKDATNHEGETALMLAVKSLLRNQECITLLVNNNVDLDCQNLNGDTAAIIAARLDRLDRLKTLNTLVQAGANMLIKNNSGSTVSKELIKIKNFDGLKLIFPALCKQEIRLGTELLNDKQFDKAFNMALAAEKEQRFNVMWTLAHTIRDKISKKDQDSHTPDRQNNKDYQTLIIQIAKYLNGITRNSPYFKKAQTELANLTYVLTEDLDCTSSIIPEERLRYALNGLPEANARLIATNTFYTMTGQIGPPDNFIRHGDHAEIFRLLAETHRKIHSLEAENAKLNERLVLLESRKHPRDIKSEEEEIASSSKRQKTSRLF